ncbi:MAG: hypothetical protein K2G97_02275, partial [Oscillospiraceae bacterium]|nr:hypothetical protein [Oscillospiraceae bacterium]
EIKNVTFYNYNIECESGIEKAACLVVNNKGFLLGVDIKSGSINRTYEIATVAGFVVTNYGKIIKCSTILSVNSKDEAGGFVSKNVGVIECCISKGEVYSLSCAGGFCGINLGQIISCGTECSVKARFSEYNTTKCGGFVGNNKKGKIYNCSSRGNVIGGEYAGGFCGDNSGEVENSNSTCDVEATAIIAKSRCGGFVGTNDGNVKDCSSTGNVKGQEYVGGFCGDNKGEIAKSDSKGDVKAKTTFTENRCGGFIGHNDKQGNIKDCNSIGSVTGEEYVGGFCGDNNGQISNSKSKGDAEIIEGIINNNRCGGFIGCNDEYGEIYDCISLGSAKGVKYIGGFCGDNRGKIADSKSKGTSRVIEHIININKCGGFAGANYGVINNCTSTGSAKGQEYVGGFCGDNKGEISKSKSEGDAKSSTEVKTNSCGGFIGENSGNINDCNSIGCATGEEHVGGFAGVNKSEIVDCNAYGKAIAKTKMYTAFAGGFVGENEKGTIISCTATGGADSRSRSGQAKAGGFVGVNKAIIMKSKASGSVYLSAGTCYKDDGCGGFVGKNDQGGSIEGCYVEATVETTNKKKGGGFVGEAKSKSTIKNSQCK